jgi:formate hydrogenlyase subunit 6/NADH:ubiquinone oxidoreductase subunit I
MKSLAIFTNFFSESDPQLLLHSERCLRSRLNTNQCLRCVESCPSKALSLDNRKISLDTVQCTGCMACVAACPQDAFASDYDLGEMLRSCQSKADVVVSCVHQVQNHPDEIMIPCVGVLSKQFLAALLLSDCRSVSFNMIGCTECRNHDVSSVFTRNCRQIINELSDITLTKVVLAEKSEELSSPKVDRRSYLSKIRDMAVDVSKQSFLSNKSVVAPLAEPKSGRRIPFKTQLVKKMSTTVDGDSQQKLLDLFAYDVSINEECNCCPLCKGICPTGAIKIDRYGQGKEFKFEMLDCSGCGLCVEFCKKNALSLERFSLNRVAHT